MGSRLNVPDQQQGLGWFSVRIRSQQAKPIPRTLSDSETDVSCRSHSPSAIETRHLFLSHSHSLTLAQSVLRALFHTTIVLDIPSHNDSVTRTPDPRRLISGHSSVPSLGPPSPFPYISISIKVIVACTLSPPHAPASFPVQQTLYDESRPGIISAAITTAALLLYSTCFQYPSSHFVLLAPRRTPRSPSSPPRRRNHYVVLAQPRP